MSALYDGVRQIKVVSWPLGHPVQDIEWILTAISWLPSKTNNNTSSKQINCPKTKKYSEQKVILCTSIYGIILMSLLEWNLRFNHLTLIENQKKNTKLF